MIVIKIIKQIVHKIDHTILRPVVGNNDLQEKLLLPKQYTDVELKRIFLQDYVKSQPSMLRVILLSAYVNARRLLTRPAKGAFRKMKGQSS